jgi:hypothetical protein
MRRQRCVTFHRCPVQGSSAVLLYAPCGVVFDILVLATIASSFRLLGHIGRNSWRGTYFARTGVLPIGKHNYHYRLEKGGVT